jgi:hypothetical protein
MQHGRCERKTGTPTTKDGYARKRTAQAPVKRVAYERNIYARDVGAPSFINRVELDAELLINTDDVDNT